MDLGDDLANRRPNLPEANSAYAILTHCLGVMEYWGGGTVAERTFSRDRRAEFVASGGVEELAARARAARRRLAEDIAGHDSTATPANVHPKPDDPVPYDVSKGAVLVHMLAELYQHLGQMELTRDLAGGRDRERRLRAHRLQPRRRGAHRRVEEWQALVASSVRTLEADATTVRLVLDGSDDALLRAAALGQLEKACCPFFDVSIDLAADASHADVGVCPTVPKTSWPPSSPCSGREGCPGCGLDAQIVDGALDDRAVDAAGLGQLVQDRHDQMGRVHLEVGAQRLAVVRAPEAVGARASRRGGRRSATPGRAPSACSR